MRGQLVLSWFIGAASIVVPMAAVLMTLSFSGLWVVVALVGAAAFSVLLIELGAGDLGLRRAPEPGPARIPRTAPAVIVYDAFGTRVDAAPSSDHR